MPENSQARRGIATVCLSGTLSDKLRAAAAAGFDGIEIFENDLVASPLSPSDVACRCADLGLSIDLYQPFRNAEGAPADRFVGVVRRMRHKLDVISELGAPMVLICSSVAPDTLDDDHLAADQLSRLADLAAERGIRIAYEALAWGRCVSTWDHAWRIVEEANHPSLGLCLDSFHVLARTDDYAAIADLPGEKIFFLQLADAPRLSMDVLQWSRHHRLFPMQGGLDLPGFTSATLAAGYAGPLSLEVFNDVFRQADPYRTAVDAQRSLVLLQDQMADATSARHAIAPAPPLAGVAFAELCVDAHSAPELGDAMRALGFAHTGQHRSKPVQLWEQGAARILLNSAVVTSQFPPGTAWISAFAVESADPATLAARAADLHMPERPRRRGQAEADLTAVAAPDGTEMFFCRTEPIGEHGWLDDFLPTGEQPNSDPIITGIDHISLAQPFDRFEEAGLFYRSVLGLVNDEASELAAPFGLVRTLAVRDAAAAVRIVLSAPLLRPGDRSAAVNHPQHITVTTPDIQRAAQKLSRADVPLLPIPANYYEDLEARLDLNPALLRRLRTVGAMYDQDAHGSYLQIFTPALGGQVFLEISQRVDGYRGYGFHNAPIRMAADRTARLNANSTQARSSPLVTSTL